MTSFEYNFIIKHFPTLQRLKTYMSKYHRTFMGLDGERWCTLDNEEQAFRAADYRHRLSDPGEMNELINDFRDMTWNAVDILNKKYCIKWASLSNSYTV